MFSKSKSVLLRSELTCRGLSAHSLAIIQRYLCWATANLGQFYWSTVRRHTYLFLVQVSILLGLHSIGHATPPQVPTHIPLIQVGSLDKCTIPSGADVRIFVVILDFDVFILVKPRSDKFQLDAQTQRACGKSDVIVYHSIV